MHEGLRLQERTALLQAEDGGLEPYNPDFNPCMDGSCGSRISIGLGELVGCGHVYGV